MVEKLLCAECGATLTGSGGPGRPARYCGPVCRRAAEYDLRRRQSLLTRAERLEQDARLKAAMAEAWQGKTCGRLLGFWAAEVQRLRAELRTALGGTEEGFNPGDRD